jgi:dCTP deaminase
MPLVDYQIRGLLLDGVVENGLPELVNPASLDVRLGVDLLVENPDGSSYNSSDRWNLISLEDFSKDNPWWLPPGALVLGHTIEIFHFPPSITGQFLLKSSRAREGYENALAGWCDPGWNGSALTVELKNFSQYHALPLYPGLKIGQIVFHAVDRPLSCYRTTGRYNQDRGAAASKG